MLLELLIQICLFCITTICSKLGKAKSYYHESGNQIH